MTTADAEPSGLLEGCAGFGAATETATSAAKPAHTGSFPWFM
jgi:hypothetical protein